MEADALLQARKQIATRFCAKLITSIRKNHRSCFQHGAPQVKDRVDKNLVKENDNIRKYMQQIKVEIL